MSINDYYTLKPLIPRWIQILGRRLRVRHQVKGVRHCWPIDETCGAPPPVWPGWPEGKRFALVLTHDVEQRAGVAKCEHLAELEQQLGFKSTFGFVPLRYSTPERLLTVLRKQGFEIMVHDFNHDGKLYRSRKIFEQRHGSINFFLERWSTRGFGSGSSLHHLAWINELNIDFDISSYDVDPFEPQPCGLGRIFPFWVQQPTDGGRGYVELPYTLPQDFTLFILMQERDNAIWRRKLDWIAEKGGMALIKAHPDYMAFGNNDRGIDRYPVEFYTDFLRYVRERYNGEFWLAQPSEVARYWRELSPSDHANAIAFRDMFCRYCREAHEKGWFSDYRPLRPRIFRESIGLSHKAP